MPPEEKRASDRVNAEARRTHQIVHRLSMVEHAIVNRYGDSVINNRIDRLVQEILA